ncbi:hypothetical protein [Histophilus somni]|uniref:hypothetical protein n=1 Tax=Histophilus somni TaxID=731 RepID=UPI00201E7DBA|nr:hypothetical protein [Histophilus somni]
MGFGGILASIAHGLGGGMIKVADEGWKKEADERKNQFYADQKALDREAELILLDRKHQNDINFLHKKNAISQAVNNSPNMKAMNEIKDAFDAMDAGNKEIARLDELLADKSLSKEQREKLTTQRQAIYDHVSSVANNEEIWKGIDKGRYGQAILGKHIQMTAPYKKTPSPVAVSQKQANQPIIVPKPDKAQLYGEDIMRRYHNGELLD